MTYKNDVMKLYCENLVKKYGVRTVVKGVSMEVEQGEIVGFLGPNGAGKTTSFYMITGQITPNGGRVFLDGEDITGLPMFERAQKGIGYLPQDASVFRKLSVEDNIMSVMELSDMTKEERAERLESLIDEFNLSKVRKSLGIQLSGGERRRCEIARALAKDPKFILLDEPFAGVDPIAVEDIQYIIAKLKYRNIGVIITDHNVGETLAITDRAYLLYEGTILQQGTPQELAADEDVRTKYLGSGFILKRSVSVERARAVVDGRLAQGPWRSFLRAVGCGLIIDIAVWLYKSSGSILPVIFGVPLFILCGFYHSIADVVYLVAAWEADPAILWYYPVIVVGNYVGCNVRRVVLPADKK